MSDWESHMILYISRGALGAVWVCKCGEMFDSENGAKVHFQVMDARKVDEGVDG